MAMHNIFKQSGNMVLYSKFDKKQVYAKAKYLLYMGLYGYTYLSIPDSTVLFAKNGVIKLKQWYLMEINQHRKIFTIGANH